LTGDQKSIYCTLVIRYNINLMSGPGFKEGLHLRSGILEDFFESPEKKQIAREKAEQQAKLARFDKIKKEGIVQGTKVLYKGHKWTVNLVWSSGRLNLSRVTSVGATVEAHRVDALKVKVIR